jgi:hypothetical protein
VRSSFTAEIALNESDTENLKYNWQSSTYAVTWLWLIVLINH